MSLRHALIAAAVIVAALAPILSASSADLITGRASVVDGDTIDIGDERVRFHGIDAPESWQRCHDASGNEYRCGSQAAAALEEWLAKSRPTRCEFVSRDRNKRFVGRCFRADGVSVASWLVRNGHALDWPRYSKGAYAADQAAARQAKAGVLQGEFVLPWEARRARRSR